MDNIIRWIGFITGEIISLIIDKTVVVIVRIVVLGHELFKETPEVVVVRLVFEPDVGTVLQIELEFVRQPPAENIEGSGYLFLLDLLILFVPVFALLVLPG